MGDLVWVKKLFAQTLIEYFSLTYNGLRFLQHTPWEIFFNVRSAPKGNRTTIDINNNLVKILVWANKIVAAVVKTSNHFRQPLLIFFKKKRPSNPAACILCPLSATRVSRDLASFSQESHKIIVYQNIVKYGRKAKLSAKSCSVISELIEN